MPPIYHLTLAPHCYLTSAALPVAKLTPCCLAALPVVNPGLIIAALPIALLLTSTASPAVITVYKVELRSLKYNPNASTVLLPKLTRHR